MKNAWLIQQGVWNMPQESMPLAAGYLKAAAYSDERLKSTFNIKIFNFKGGESGRSIVTELLREEMPNLLAFSVYGWNYHNFMEAIRLYKSVNPEGWVVLGGPHVSYQGKRILRKCSGADIVVNGEGEVTFCEILRVYLDGQHKNSLQNVTGITFTNGSREIVCTADRPPVYCLDEIESPFLSNVLDLRDHKGQRRYDVAILETMRGCPHSCAFCYLGSTKHQKIRKFSRERLREELEIIAYQRYDNVVLCDPNFGSYSGDEEFLEDLIKIKERYAYPKYLETSWTKIKTERFFRMVDRMASAQVGTSCTFAVQSFNEHVLENMNRSRLDEEKLSESIQRLKQKHIECYGELIWGGPGETISSFLEGYDKFSKHISKIATYPMLLLPNTTFFSNRHNYGIVAIGNKASDFEYIAEHNSMTIEDNRKMHRFLFWSRLLVENSILRGVWEAVNLYLNITRSQVLLSLDLWIDHQNDSAAIKLREFRNEMMDSLDASRITTALHYIYTDRLIVDDLFTRWWKEEILPVTPAHVRLLFMELLRYDLITRPIYEGIPEKFLNGRVRLREVFSGGEWHYKLSGMMFLFDIPEIVNCMVRGIQPKMKLGKFSMDIIYRKGFSQYIDNHEMIKQYIGAPQYEEAERAENIYVA